MFHMTNAYKKASLLIIVGVLSGLFWFWIKPLIGNFLQLSSDYYALIKPLTALIVLAAVEGTALLVANHRYWRWGITVVASAPYFAVFGLSGLYWTVVPIAVLLQIYAGHEIHSEVDERIKINIGRIMKRGLPHIVTAVLIMISFAFYLSPATQSAAHQQQISPSLKKLIEKTVSVFAGSEIQNLPPVQRQTLLAQATNEVARQFNAFLGPYFKYLPPVLAFGLFLILQGLSFIFVWLGIGLATLIFWVLKKSGLARVKVTQKEAEELEW